MYRDFVDSRDGFDAQTEAEYNAYLDEKDWAMEDYDDACDYDDDDDCDVVLCDDDDDHQPDEYTEWQDYMGGDDWDHGQYDCEY